MAPKHSGASAEQAAEIRRQDEVPVLGPLRQPFQLLREVDFIHQVAFAKACSMLRKLFVKIGASPEEKRLRKLPRSSQAVASELLAVPGFEEALVEFGWKATDSALTFDGDASVLQAAAVQIHEVEAWVLRRGTHLVNPVRDPEGWSCELHHPEVLLSDPKFKGAVWHISHRGCRPDGVVVFHNSPFSNYLTCGSKVRIMHEGQEFSCGTSEAIIMAFKEHLLTDRPLPEALSALAPLHSGSEAKQEVARRIRNVKDTLIWRQHGVHVLVGASACLPKFAQDEGMRRLLLSTRQAVLIEAAPHDGTWGVGMHVGHFLWHGNPAHFVLASSDASTEGASLRYETRDGKVIDRRLCEANALGKALMIVRDILVECDDTGEEVPVDLKQIMQRVGRQLRARGAPFPWQGLHASLDGHLT